MRVLVLGSGGREHVLAWKLSQSKRVEEVWCAPGNAGIARDARIASLDIDSAAGLDEAVCFAREKRIDLTVVGPEAPLVAGAVDRFEAAGLRVFGPRKDAAELEGSKCFTKEFMARHSIPTANFAIFETADDARAHIEAHEAPLVVKADGLAAGKGVIVAASRKEALGAIDTIMVERKFGAAGDRVVIEDYMPGRELTVIVLTDGETAIPLETAQDYKPVFDGNRGPNTGGMGSYSPHVALGDPLINRIMEEIVDPTLRGLREDGIEYRGALYVGLMITSEGPKVVEYNVRFGDPEVQSIMMRLRSDLVDAFEACLDGRLAELELEWDPRSAVCVVGASAGYPGTYEKGLEIQGIDEAEESGHGDVKVFVAGASAAAESNRRLLTSGGRVLGVTALGASLSAARELAYGSIGRVYFDGMHRRTDIGLPVER